MSTLLNYGVYFVGLAQSNLWISLAFYCLFVIGVMCLPVTMFPIIGGVLFPFWLALPFNLAAATLGAWLSYKVVHHFGRHAIEPYLKGKIASWDKITTAQGFKTVLMLRLVGIPPFIVTNYALGFSGVKDLDFVTGTVLGILPWMSVMTLLSHSLWTAVKVGGEHGLAKALMEVSGPLSVMSVIALVVFLTRFRLERRKKQRQSNL